MAVVNDILTDCLIQSIEKRPLHHFAFLGIQPFGDSDFAQMRFPFHKGVFTPLKAF